MQARNAAPASRNFVGARYLDEAFGDHVYSELKALI
jgi:hypothetical protein